MAIPGLPALAEGVVIDAVQLAFGDAVSSLSGLAGQQWGLFLNGEPAVISDNVLSFEFKQDFRNSSFPVEEGAFETYNKVQVPYDVRLQFSTGGSVSDRQALIQSIDAIIGSTDLFDGVTPEKVYQSINPVHQSLRRTSRNGLGLLVIDVYCEQIRVTAQQQFTSSQTSSATDSSGGSITQISIILGAQLINQPQSPSAAPQVSDGTVQAAPPTPAQQSAISGAATMGFGF